MTLLIHEQAFTRLANVHLTRVHLRSRIDFKRNEWLMTCLTNQDVDVEIAYLFQFDRAHEKGFVEVFHNGMDEAVLRFDILEPIKTQITFFEYILN